MFQRRKVAAGILATSLLLGGLGLGVSAQTQPIDKAPKVLVVNGNTYRFDVMPMTVEETVMVPLRGITEALGAKVSWNQATHTAQITLDDLTIQVPIGSKTVIKNGQSVELISKSLLHNDRTLVPTDFVNRVLGSYIHWSTANGPVLSIYGNADQMLTSIMQDATADEIRSLLKDGAHTTATNKQGFTPLMSAVFYGNEEAVKTLVNVGANPNVKTPQGYVPLPWAARYHNQDIIKDLIRGGADLNGTDQVGWTALMHTVYNGDTDNTQILLHAGANPNIRDSDGQTALRIAIDHGFAEVVSILQQAGAVQ